MKQTTFSFLMVLVLGSSGLAGCGENSDVAEDNPTAEEPAGANQSDLTVPPPDTDATSGSGSQ